MLRFLRVFQRSPTGVSGKFQECFKKISRIFQVSFIGVSRKIEGCFKGVFSGFQGYLKEVKGNLREV